MIVKTSCDVVSSNPKQLEFANHPCFNQDVRELYGRIHLPVAPRCNVQCNFCNRKYACANESRPGVTATLMTPDEALRCCESYIERTPNISVVGIAGPGDPFANPAETLRTLRLVRERFSDVMLCIAANGLNLLPYLDELVSLGVSHATVTVNAVDPAVGAQIYSWIEVEGQRRSGPDAAEFLWTCQRQTIRELSRRGIFVKVNTVYIPGVNSLHVEEISRTVAQYGATIQNLIPLLPVADTAFANLRTPTPDEVTAARKCVAKHLPQMTHCSHCRADAVGLLSHSEHATTQLEPENMTPTPNAEREYIAVASSNGKQVDCHLGEVDYLLIYNPSAATPQLVDLRRLPPQSGRQSRLAAMAGMLQDCSLLLVGGVGPGPKAALQKQGVRVRTVQGQVAELLKKVAEISAADEDVPFVCGEGCHGNGRGCGCSWA
jgi:nitrogen fixation protein NifB